MIELRLWGSTKQFPVGVAQRLSAINDSSWGSTTELKPAEFASMAVAFAAEVSTVPAVVRLVPAAVSARTLAVLVGAVAALQALEVELSAFFPLMRFSPSLDWSWGYTASAWALRLDWSWGYTASAWALRIVLVFHSLAWIALVHRCGGEALVVLVDQVPGAPWARENYFFACWPQKMFATSAYHLVSPLMQCSCRPVTDLIAWKTSAPA
jgi:hypothetical protein